MSDATTISMPSKEKMYSRKKDCNIALSSMPTTTLFPSIAFIGFPTVNA